MADTSGSAWYSARLLYENQIESSERDLYEEKIVVFTAHEDDAVVDIVAKVEQIAKSQDEEFQNKFGQTVRWTFQEILEIQEISGGLGDGTEVFFRWWENPSKADFTFLRRSHGDQWWRSDSNQ